jgi:hypothetical protein
LGLTDDAFWQFSHREIMALRRRFLEHQKLQITLTAGIRADVRNAAGWTKDDKSAWQTWDFGADEPKASQVRPYARISKERARSYFEARFGKRMKGEKKSVLDGLQGQPLPIRKVG